jgi:Calx-beta domain/RTX calcium-binding nonapeptide repeat (4 copies)
MRKAISLGFAVLLAGLIATGVVAGTVVGTPRNDVLRGSAKADRMDGKAGNDKLYGLAGNDLLIGGAGNDLLVGGPGRDTFKCGVGKDKVVGDAKDVKPGADCEAVKGLPKPALSISDATIAEGNSGTTTLSFEVGLSAASRGSVSVSFATADGTAVAPSDYQPASGTITFKPGETTNAVNVAVVGDAAYEPDEVFTVSLSSSVGATIAKGSATGMIQNDDPAVRSGHYAGATSQGKPIKFDVSSDLKTLSNGSFGFDLNCTEVQGFTVTDTFEMSPVAIGPDLGFSARGEYSDKDVSIVVLFEGKLSAPGNASGTLSITLELYDVPGIGTLHCGTGSQPVTWNAA